MNIILSTRNREKVREISAIFADTHIAVRSLEDVGITGEVEEDGDTLGENALKKARHAWAHAHAWCMADDTGLYIDALGGVPGIHAARWAGDTASTKEIMLYTLQRLEGVPYNRRTATFKTAAVVMLPNGSHVMFTGESRGKLLTKPRTKPLLQMPYSAIFQPEGSAEVFAEMHLEAQNLVSHRGKAFRQVRDYLLSQH